MDPEWLQIENNWEKIDCKLKITGTKCPKMHAYQNGIFTNKVWKVPILWNSWMDLNFNNI